MVALGALAFKWRCRKFYGRGYVRQNSIHNSWARFHLDIESHIYNMQARVLYVYVGGRGGVVVVSPALLILMSCLVHRSGLSGRMCAKVCANVHMYVCVCWL